MKIQFIFKLTGIALLLGIFAAGTGCQTQDGAVAGPLASVMITNQTLASVQSAVADVFAENGFLGGQSGANEFTYTRIGANPAGVANSVNDTARVKAVVTTSQAANGNITVACNAWLLDSGLSPAFQNRRQTQAIRKWPYQQMLNEVKSDLGQ